MGYAKRVQFCLSACDASDIRWDVPVPASTKSRFAGGSILDADPPPQWVIFARRNTCSSSDRSRHHIASLPQPRAASVARLNRYPLRNHYRDMCCAIRFSARHAHPDDPRHIVGHGDGRDTHRVSRQQRREMRRGFVGSSPELPDQRGGPDDQQTAQVFLSPILMIRSLRSRMRAARGGSSATTRDRCAMVSRSGIGIAVMLL